MGEGAERHKAGPATRRAGPTVVCRSSPPDVWRRFAFGVNVVCDFPALNADPLLSVDKERLVRTIREQEQQIEKLRREIESLRHENEKLKQKPDPFKNKASRAAGKRSKPPHLWGRKQGHKGSWRPEPDHIDREVVQTLEVCPRCKNPLGACEDFEEHIQEDIIPARVEVTRYRHYRYWCGHCQDHVLASYAPDEIPYAKLGPKALTMMVLLKYYYALPGNKIKAIFEGLCGLKVSEGGIAQALQRLSRYLKVETDIVLTKIRAAAVKHADETGWNVNGVNHWLWVFLNEMWVYDVIHRSRGAKVPKAILGEKPEGTLVSDFDTICSEQEKLYVASFAPSKRSARKAHLLGAESLYTPSPPKGGEGKF